jgi:hypothetical protein
MPWRFDFNDDADSPGCNERFAIVITNGSPSVHLDLRSSPQMHVLRDYEPIVTA